MSTYQDFEEELKLIRLDLQNYTKNLNDSGIWLFLATLGCWGVNQPLVRVIAVILTFAIFTMKLFNGISCFKLFTTKIEEQASKVDKSDLDERSKKALKFDLYDFKKKQLGKFRMFAKVPAYHFSMIFLGISIFYW